MKVCIIGGGNVGTLISAQFTHQKNEVILYTRSAKNWNGEITVHDMDSNTSFKEKIYKITDNLKDAISGAEFIVVTIPSLAQKELIQKLEKLNLKDTILCFYPGTGGGEIISSKLLKNNVTICGPQRICSVARLMEPTSSVKTTGKRDLMYLGCIPIEKGNEVREKFETLFDIKTKLLPNYLSVTLTPSNPILHPSRLYTIFKDYKDKVFYKKIPLFYEDWNDETSELLINCDKELHNIISKLDFLDLKDIKPLLDHYESTNAKELTNKIKSIKGFKGIETPSLQTENGYIPNLESRYFTADIPYGLLIIKDFGIICNVETPEIDKIINWYQKIVKKEYLKDEKTLGKDTTELNLPSNYGMNRIEDIINFYKGKEV